MKIRKLLALLLALLSVTAILAACGDTPAENETTTVAVAQTSGTTTEETDNNLDAEGYWKDDLAESYNMNKVITILYDTHTSRQEYFAESTNGEAINDALYTRNATVEKRLGVTLNFVGEAGNDGNEEKFLKAAQNDVSGGTSEYAIYSGYSRTIPLLAMNGLCGNLLDTEYINVEQPWWPEALTYECTLNDTLYFCTGDISTNMLWQMSCLIYNKTLWENALFEGTPEEYVKSGEWVLDKFIDLTKDFYIDDGNGVVDRSDTFGLTAYSVCHDAWLNACGVISIKKNNEGALELSPDFTGDKTATLVSKLGSYLSNNSCFWSSETGVGRGIFKTNQALFMIDSITVIPDIERDSDGLSYSIVPIPKYDQNQATYITNLRYLFNFYAINKMTGDKNEASAVLEAMASKSYRSVTPVLFEVTMKSRYSNNDITAQMYDILRENIVFDFGRIYAYSLTNYYPDFRNRIFAGGAGWSSLMVVTKKKVPSYLTAITESFED